MSNLGEKKLYKISLPDIDNIKAQLLQEGCFHQINAPHYDVNTFNAFLHELGDHFSDYIGGSSPRSQLCGAVYSSTDLPGDYTIPLHQEMSYLNRYPRYIVFYCAQSAVTGGETTWASARTVTQSLSQCFLDKYRDRQAEIVRVLPDKKSLLMTTGMSKSWQDTFATHCQETVLALCRSRGWKARFLSDLSLELNHGLLPLFRTHPITGEMLWFNQVHYYSAVCAKEQAFKDGRLTNYRAINRFSKNNRDKLSLIYLDDGNLFPENDLIYISQILLDAEKEINWQNNELVIFDNLLFFHGRRPFSGRRVIFTGLLKN